MSRRRKELIVIKGWYYCLKCEKWIPPVERKGCVHSVCQGELKCYG